MKKSCLYNEFGLLLVSLLRWKVGVFGCFRRTIVTVEATPLGVTFRVAAAVVSSAWAVVGRVTGGAAGRQEGPASGRGPAVAAVESATGSVTFGVAASVAGSGRTVISRVTGSAAGWRWTSWRRRWRASSSGWWASRRLTVAAVESAPRRVAFGVATAVAGSGWAIIGRVALGTADSARRRWWWTARWRSSGSLVAWWNSSSRSRSGNNH